MEIQKREIQACRLTPISSHFHRICENFEGNSFICSLHSFTAVFLSFDFDIQSKACICTDGLEFRRALSLVHGKVFLLP